MAENENLTGDTPEAKEAAEAKAKKDAEEKEAAEAAAGEVPEPDPEFDYTDVLVDNDKVELEKGEKITFAEAKKRNALYKKHKELLEKAEKDPDFLNKLAKTVEPDPGKGAPVSEISAEKKVTQQLLRSEFERRWEAIKEKYPLVEKHEVAARILALDNPDLDQVEKQAQNLQQYFDKKLGEKEKKKIEARKNADDINPQGGAGPGSGSKATDKSKSTGLEDIDELTKDVEAAISNNK